MSDHATIVALLKAVGDRPIAFHTAFAKLGGSVQAGIFLSQAFYWSLRTDDPDGWFYKETKEFQEETMLTRHEQDGARKALRATGVLEEKRAGDHAILHYRVNFVALASAIAEKRQRPLPETVSDHCRIPAVAIAEKRQSVPSVSICTEITSETTTQNGEWTAYQERQKLEAERLAEKQSRRGKKAPFQRSQTSSPKVVTYESAPERRAREAREQVARVVASLPPHR